jgi:Sec-independent protein translocase protein TatA
MPCQLSALVLVLQAVAGAALAASALMNAPPGFLEFLLCIPWRRLPQLYPSTAAAVRAAGKAARQQQCAQQQQDPHQQQDEQQQQQVPAEQQNLLAESAADEAERRLLVNLPLHPQLVRPVLLFMYKPQHANCVPPVLRPEKRQEATKQQQAQQQQQQQPTPQPSECTADENLLAVVEALLDGATPLHCAALRGNPAQVDHLLYCGADPTRKTAAGDLPMQLVPRCGGYSQNKRVCTCLGPAEQEVRQREL